MDPAKMKRVTVTLTNRVIGKTVIVPFNLTEGAQYYPPGHPKAGNPMIYLVDKYALVVNGSTEYGVVRFGLQNRGTIQSTRTADAGITCGLRVQPTWVPGYRPHSFEGSDYVGAWRIIDGKSFLMHEGADTGLGRVGGSLGCIEVLDGRWPDFQDELINICEQEWPIIGQHRLMTLEIQAAPAPTTLLVR